MMKIKDIKFVENGETRMDGRCPLRIGSTVEFFTEPKIGQTMIISYIKDNEDNKKSGYLHTSKVQKIEENKKDIIITTVNSIYHFENR